MRTSIFEDAVKTGCLLRFLRFLFIFNQKKRKSAVMFKKIQVLYIDGWASYI